MKLKLKEVLTISTVLKTIIDDTSSRIDPLLKFKLLGLLKATEGHVENFQEVRNEKINEYGENDEDGNIFIPKENQEAIKQFNDALGALVDSEVTVTADKSKAGDIFNKGIPAQYLIALYPLIEE